jgi:hypothetical protein
MTFADVLRRGRSHPHRQTDRYDRDILVNSQSAI